MNDYTKYFLCKKCEKIVLAENKYTFDDYLKFKNKMPVPIKGVIVRKQDFNSYLMYPEGIEAEWINWEEVNKEFINKQKIQEAIDELTPDPISTAYGVTYERVVLYKLKKRLGL